MATIIERDIHHAHDAGSDSSAVTMIVTVVALLAIVGFALFFFRLLPFGTATDTNNNRGSTTIDVRLPTQQAPTTTPTPTPNTFNQ